MFPYTLTLAVTVVTALIAIWLIATSGRSCQHMVVVRGYNNRGVLYSTCKQCGHTTYSNSEAARAQVANDIRIMRIANGYLYALREGPAVWNPEVSAEVQKKLRDEIYKSRQVLEMQDDYANRRGQFADWAE